MTPLAWHGVLFVAAFLGALTVAAFVLLGVAGRRPRGRLNRALVWSGVPDVKDNER